MPVEGKQNGQASVRYGRHSIAYEVREHSASRLRIDVHPDLRVVAHVPEGKSEQEIQERVRRRAPWILRQIREFSKYHPLPTPKQYRSGESVFYLGRQYRLKILGRSDEGVKLRAGRLEVSTPHRARIEALILNWYRCKAQDYFADRAEVVRPRLSFLGDQPIRIQVRPMKTRWGSCSAAGLISLNPDLVKAPSPCIEYVILHELCHLNIHGHSPEFYRLLDRTMPDWRKRRARLNTFGAHMVRP